MVIKDATAAKKALVFGTLSAVLFFGLYLIADLTVEWAQLTRQGEKIYFLGPIIIAFVFSYVHGYFTGLFWDMLGFKPAAKKSPKK